ncbi:MAG: tRNA (adenosine(37)-N6)-threonylcarbamoyltransferase complex dimerization subunit type 1 TsaB [Tannerella sp.]|nr:tRNA (adenosine(37)-N6)-threonylcarbamoyltransferase complex dimerization subunit type 1 TsaB [Tannerella sp.]
MACILHIETSTAVCSVALSVHRDLVFEKTSYDGPSHAALSGIFVEEALAFMKGHGCMLDAVAVGGGPGSYTGLRIGTSMAKGLCLGYNIPLIAVPTLDLLASGAIRQVKDNRSLYCAMLDARRMEVYAAVYRADLSVVRETGADIVTPDIYNAYLDDNSVYFFGNGAAKCKEMLRSPRAIFVDGIYPLAKDMIALAEKRYQARQFEDIAYFEPFYLKKFMATVPKNKVLGGL